MDKEIKALHFGEGESYIVGHGDTFFIREVYRKGQMADVRWFEICDKDKNILHEVNGAFVHIVEFNPPNMDGTQK